MWRATVAWIKCVQLFKKHKEPHDNPKKKNQVIVYMDVVDYLKPKYLLMENAVDLLEYTNGYCGRYALGRLVDMNYQTRMGMMVAGAYGLPQFDMCVFLWGARPPQRLAQYPLPTHDRVLRGDFPIQFKMNAVAYDEGQNIQLKNKLYLEMPFLISQRLTMMKLVMRFLMMMIQRLTSSVISGGRKNITMTGPGTEFLTSLYDHRPLQLNVKDYRRVCRVPKRKVPNSALAFVRGTCRTSTKPFERLRYDETVAIVITTLEPHNQAICHPIQDRVLTIRENARMQGFPDYYQLKGPVEERYLQVGNAVAVPVARALGYALAVASQGRINDEPVLTLPAGFLSFPDRAAAPSAEVKHDN